MTGLLALLQCKKAHKGPWMRPNGGKVAAKMYPALGQGERVFVEVEVAGSYNRAIELHDEVTPLDLAEATRYRVQKMGEGTPTTVEIVPHG